jgi:hypothetical protein
MLRRHMKGLVAILGSAMVLAACAAPAPAPAPNAPSGSSPSPVPGAAVPRPGLTRNADGTYVGYGYVVRVALEGAFWALAPQPSSGEATPPVIAVLLSGKVTTPQIAAASGRYVRVTGIVRTGTVSIRMAGPELVVDTLEALAPNRP